VKKKVYFRLLFAGFLLISFIMSGCLSSIRWRREPVSSIGLVDIFAPGVEFKIEEGVDAASGQLLVKLKPGADPGEVFQVVDGKEIQYFEELGWYLIAYGPGRDLVTAGRQLLETGQVYYLEPNYLVEKCTDSPAESFAPPNDPWFDQQWSLEMINAPAGWEVTTGSEEIIIAIVDTGIDHNHPDLEGKVVDGYNFVNDTAGKPGDDEGHGTFVAGIAAAKTGNGIGVAGVAPACWLMPVKVLDATGTGTINGIARGIIWAVNKMDELGVTGVINLSLSGKGYSRFFHDAVDYALERNIPVVAASGNRYKYDDELYPAGFPGVISIGAVKKDETIANFSSKGGNLFLAAPGQGIFSILPMGGYGYGSGTSASAPFVSGTIALLKSRWPELDIDGIHAQLRKTAKDLAASGWDPETGWGLLNLGEALAGDEPQENNLFGSLEITVVDNEGVSRPYARVLLRGGNRDLAAMTNIDGKVLFRAQPAGNYTIEAAIDGFSGKGEATIIAGEACTVTVSLTATGN
jgi:subtilisin family serine protease